MIKECKGCGVFFDDEGHEDWQYCYLCHQDWLEEQRFLGREAKRERLEKYWTPKRIEHRLHLKRFFSWRKGKNKGKTWKEFLEWEKDKAEKTKKEVQNPMQTKREPEEGK